MERSEVIFKYISEQPEAWINGLYEDLYVCMAVFRSLPESSKQFLLRFLFFERGQALRVDEVASWVIPEFRREVDGSIEKMTRLRVMQVTESRHGGDRSILLQENFRINMQRVITGETRSQSQQQLDVGREGVLLKDIEDNAKNKWEEILKKVADPKNNRPEGELEKILSQLNLIKKTGYEEFSATREGFHFLLENTHSQIWKMLIQYISTVEDRAIPRQNVIKLLFRFTFMSPGKDYDRKSLSREDLTIIDDFRQFGLIYQNKDKTSRYYPSSLAVNLCSDVLTQKRTEGYLVVETNHKIYAYTNSDLQIRVIVRFCKLQYRFQNLVVGMITRKSVNRAFDEGITAQQLVDFLEMNTHPNVSEDARPKAVYDQIRYWYKERDRITPTPGVLIYINDPRHRDIITQKAKDNSSFLWSDYERILVISQEGKERILGYCNQLYQS